MRRRGRDDEPAPLGPILDHYEIVVPPKLGWSKIRCPFHDEDEPSCVVDVEGGGFSCFACGAKGRGPVSFIMQKESLPYEEARPIFESIYGDTSEPKRRGPQRVARGGYRPRYRRANSPLV